MASARFHAGGAVVAAADASAHRMLVVAGMDSNRRLLDSCELYDAVVDRWLMEEARLLEEMRCCAAPIAGGSAVLAVQLDDEEKTRCALLDVRSSSACWQPMASAPIASRWHTVAAVGEHSVVMFGGWDEDADTDTAQLYDARADRWSERAEWRLPAPSSGHCAVVIG